MEITIRETYPYQEIELRKDNTIITTGLLDKDERKVYVETFIQAAIDLIYDNEHRPITDKLETALEDFKNIAKNSA